MPDELSQTFNEWYQAHPLQIRGDEGASMLSCDVMDWLDENRDFILMYLNKEEI